MERVIIAKDDTYGASQATLTAAMKNLTDGQIGVYGALQGKLLEGTGADANYLNEKEIIIAYGAGGKVFQSKPISRRGIINFEAGTYLAPVMHTVVAGGATSTLSLSIEDTDVGDVIVGVHDKNFSSMFTDASNIASVYKTASMTAEQAVDAVVAKLNANTSLPVTATKIGSSPDFGITIQSTKRGQVLSLTLDGLIAGDYRGVDGTAPSVLPVNGNGVAADVLAHEREVSTYRGNSFYRELEQEFYSQPYSTDPAATYNTYVIKEGLNRPYDGETNVKPEITVYIPTGATALITEFLAVMAKVIAGKDVAATEEEPGNA